MTTVRNQRDKLLRMATNRELNPIATGIRLSLSSPGFHQLASGMVDLPLVTVEAELIELTGEVTFSVFNGLLGKVEGRRAEVMYNGGMAIVTATVVRAGQTFARSIIIPVVRDGQAGNSTYVWIRYADDEFGSGLSDQPTGKTYIAISQNRPTPVESNDPADYSYVLIKGSDGRTLRMWIKYSDNPDGANPYDTPTDATMYIGIAVNRDDPVESNNPAEYVWSRFKGGDGISIPGSRGAGFYRTPGNEWTDTAANNATPGGNEIGDMVTISNGVVSYTKVWDGDSWENPGAFLSGSLFVEKSIGAAQINANGLSLYTPDGRLVIDAGHTLVEQTRANPNLVPAPLGWTIFQGGASANRNGDGRYGDGSYFWLPASPDNTHRGIVSPECRIPSGIYYCVSFDAYCESGSRDLNVDLYANGELDSPGKVFAITQVYRKFSFTELMPNSSFALSARLRMWTVSAGGNLVIGNVKVETGTNPTPWVDSTISPANSAGRVMPDSITNVQFGGDLWSSNWNGSTGAGGQGWLLRRNGDLYANNITARGRIIGSLIESSAFKIDSGRLLTPWDRLCPFSISDMNMQMWSSGSGDCVVELRDFVGPLESVVGSYNVKRFADMIRDVFLKAHINSISTGGNAILEVMYNNDGWWRVITVVPLRAGALTLAIRYTTEGGVWDRLHFRARTDGGVSTSLAFEMNMNNLNTALYLGGSNSGVSMNTPPPPPPPPPYEEPEPDDPWCVDYETSYLPTGRLVRHVVVDDLIQVWDDNAESPSIEYAPALKVRIGYEQSYWMRSESGAEIIQSKSTPMTLRDGRVTTTPDMLGEEVLVNRFGILTWEPVIDLVDMGIRRVVKLSLGDRMYFAGMHPDTTIATHNARYKP